MNDLVNKIFKYKKEISYTYYSRDIVFNKVYDIKNFVYFFNCLKVRLLFIQKMQLCS